MIDSSLRLLLDFDKCVKRDEGQSPQFLHRRDRKFALTCEGENTKPNVARWVAHINHFSGPGASKDSPLHSLLIWQRVTHSFMGVGAVFGVLSMLALLFYDGGQRINITLILAFVALQFSLAILTMVQSVVGWQPWSVLLQRFVKRFQKESGSTILPKLHPLLMGRAAQLGGLCFTLFGLVTLLVMVVLQDLAFGWSTTLETSAYSYHWLVNVIAWPWAWALPAAVPDLALVEATRFFRADPNGIANIAGLAEGAIPSSLWGQWWPFIAMLWTSYAVVPRLIFCLLAKLLITRKSEGLLTSHPGMVALLYRMQTPTLDTGNEHNDSTDQPNTNTQLSVLPLPNASIVLCWAGAGDPELPAILIADEQIMAKVGGRVTLKQEQKILDQVGQALDKTATRDVVLVTRSWEPPTGELEDFITKAQSYWPKGAHIVLVPVATNTAHKPEAGQVQQWLRFAKRVNPNFVSVSLAVPEQNGHDQVDEVLI